MDLLVTSNLFQPSELRCFLYNDSIIRISYTKNFSSQRFQNLLALMHVHKGQKYDNYFEIPSSQYSKVIQEIEAQQNIYIQRLPNEYQKILNGIEMPGFVSVNTSCNQNAPSIIPAQIENDFAIDKSLVDKSRKFFGRILISGKEKENYKKNALVLVKQYRQSKPLLIVCTQEEQDNWRESAIKYLQLAENKVVIEKKIDQQKDTNPEVVVTTYDKFQKNIINFEQFVICIADEWHNLKDSENKKCKHWLPILKNMKHIIMLQKGPMIDEPQLLFPMLNILRPDIFPQEQAFQQRYCNQNQLETFHLDELHYLINKYLMYQISENQTGQKKIFRITNKIDCEYFAQEKLHSFLDSKQKRADQFVSEIMNLKLSNKKKFNFPDFNTLQQETSKGKKVEIKKYIESLQQNKGKIIVYAPWNMLLDQLSQECEQENMQNVKLYGSEKEKKINQKKFITDEKTQIAFINSKFSKLGEEQIFATDIVFAGLPLDQTQILKIEQKVIPYWENQQIIVHFLLGEYTLDGHILNAIEKKYEAIQLIFKGVKERLTLTDEEKNQLQQREQNYIPSRLFRENQERQNRQASSGIKLKKQQATKQDIKKLNQDQNIQLQQTLAVCNELEPKNDGSIKNDSNNSKNQQKVFKLVRIKQVNIQAQQQQLQEEKVSQQRRQSNLQQIPQLITQMEQFLRNSDQRVGWEQYIELLNLFFEDQKRINQRLDIIEENLKNAQKGESQKHQ